MTKQFISDITPDHIQQVPGTEHFSATPKPKIIQKDIRQDKPANADLNYRAPVKPI